MLVRKSFNTSNWYVIDMFIWSYFWHSGVEIMVGAMRQSLWLVRMMTNLQSSLFPHLAVCLNTDVIYSCFHLTWCCTDNFLYSQMSNGVLISKFSVNVHWWESCVFIYLFMVLHYKMDINQTSLNSFIIFINIVIILVSPPSTMVVLIFKKLDFLADD